jgi:hypothetical protein
LDARSNKGIFIGYSADVEAAYRILDLSTKKIVISRDCKIIDNQFSFLKQNLNTEPSSPELENVDAELNTENFQVEDVLTTSHADAEQSVHLESVTVANQQNEPEDQTTVEHHSVQDVNTQTDPPNESIANQNDSAQQSRFSKRKRKQIDHGAMINHFDNEFENEIFFTASCKEQINVPQSYEEAIQSKHSAQWKQAIAKELKSMEDNNVWTFVKRPQDCKPITTRWVFTHKQPTETKPESFGARLCCRGFNQIPELQYDQTYSPTMKYKSLKMLIAISFQYQYEMHSIDFKRAFLNSELQHIIHLHTPDGVICPPGHVIKLCKSLYGLKQSSYMWHKMIDGFLTKELQFQSLKTDPCVYLKSTNTSNKIFLGLFVDDIFVSYHKQDEDKFNQVKAQIESRFEITHSELVSILGLRIIKNNDKLMIDQTQLIEKTLTQHQMNNSNPVNTPLVPGVNYVKNPNSEPDVEVQHYQSAIGSLNYLSAGTRIDTCFATNVLSRHATNPSNEHWCGVKRVMRYLQATKSLPLVYSRSEQSEINIHVYTDSDYASDVNDRKSTAGVLLMINSNPVVWYSKKQQSVALSTCEAEFYAISFGLQDLIWAKAFIIELTQNIPECTLYCDNQASIAMSSQEVHGRSKHVDIKYKFVKEHLLEGTFKMKYVPTTRQLSDILTKALPYSAFIKLRDAIMNGSSNQDLNASNGGVL